MCFTGIIETVEVSGNLAVVNFSFPLIRLIWFDKNWISFNFNKSIQAHIHFVSVVF